MNEPSRPSVVPGDHQRPEVLVIGADRYALQACVRHHVDATVVVGAAMWDNGLIEVPDTLRTLLVDDQTSAEAILAALHRAGLGEVAWDAVHTGDEYALVTVSLLAEHFGCRTIGPETAMRFRDKSVQKGIVMAAGLPVARTTVIDDILDVSGIDELPYERAVLKPIAGAGTARTTTVTDLADLRARSREYATERIGQRVFLLEEFVPGEEWIVDGVLYDGEVLFCAVGGYSVPCLTTISENLPVSMQRFDPDTDAWIYDKAVPFATEALRALGLRDGMFHMELFHDPDTGRLVFGECGARRGGAATQEEVAAKFGVHLGECALLCSMGRRPQIDVKHRPDAIGSGYLAAEPGVLIDCPTPAQLLDLPGVEFARIEGPLGTRFDEDVANTSQCLGLVVIADATQAAVTDRLAEVRTWFAERTVTVPDRARARDLRAWQRRVVPELDLRDTLWH
jgi:biotin carboxylase